MGVRKDRGRKPRVLLVDDEIMVALDTAATLDTLGYDVVGPAGRTETALALVEKEPIDAAVLDINLHGEKSFGIAEALVSRNIPVVFLTGYAVKDAAIPLHLAHVPVLEKPLHDGTLADALAKLERP